MRAKAPGRGGRPGVDHGGHDQVVALVRAAQEAASLVDHQAHAGLLVQPAREAAEGLRRHHVARHEGVDLDGGDWRAP